MLEIGKSIFKNNRNLKIEKYDYKPKTQELFINDSLCFCNISQEVWLYKIGGHQVCLQYLKSHEGEEIDFEHFSKIIKALHQSLEIESQITQIALKDLI